MRRHSVKRSASAARKPVGALLVLALLGLAACSDTAPAPTGGDAPAASDTAAGPASPPPGRREAAMPEAAADRFIAPAPALMALLTGADLDAARGCWPVRLDIGGTRRPFCLRPGTPEWRPMGGRERVFLHAHHVPGDRREGAGAFAAIVAEPQEGGRLKALAVLRGWPVGEAGDCGCETARFRRMGRDRWGWVFAANEAGERRFHVVLAASSGLAEVARVPVPADGVDGLRHAVEFDISDEAAEAYPLLHVVLRGTQPVDVRRHGFEPGPGRYASTPGG